jgi:hypothetical protein
MPVPFPLNPELPTLQPEQPDSPFRLQPCHVHNGHSNYHPSGLLQYGQCGDSQFCQYFAAGQFGTDVLRKGVSLSGGFSSQ